MKKKTINYLLLIIITLFCTSCSSDYTDEVACEDLNFSENSNVEQICSGLYEYYDSYLGGELENHTDCTYDDCISWCAIDSFSEYINPKTDGHKEYLEACDNFISGSGGFGEIYFPSNYAEELIMWCADNFSVSDVYDKCID